MTKEDDTLGRWTLAIAPELCNGSAEIELSDGLKD
jgi:hypothetical protein